MADGRRRETGEAPQNPSNKPVLRNFWRGLVRDNIKIPVGMLSGCQNEKYTRSWYSRYSTRLGSRGGRQDHREAVQELDDMLVGEVGFTEVGLRAAHSISGVRARCTLNGWVVRRPILYPGSIRSLVERACAARLNLKGTERKLPSNHCHRTTTITSEGDILIPSMMQGCWSISTRR